MVELFGQTIFPSASGLISKVTGVLTDNFGIIFFIVGFFIGLAMIIKMISSAPKARL